MDPINIRIELNDEFSKINQLITEKAIKYLFIEFISHLKELFSKYFKLIDITFRTEKHIKTNKYFFIIIVFSNENKGKGSKKKYLITGNSSINGDTGNTGNTGDTTKQHYISKQELDSEFHQLFDTKVIKSHFQEGVIEYLNNFDAFVKKDVNILNFMIADKDDIHYLITQYIKSFYSYQKYIVKKLYLKPLYPITKYPKTKFVIIYKDIKGEYSYLIKNKDVKSIIVRDYIVKYLSLNDYLGSFGYLIQDKLIPKDMSEIEYLYIKYKLYQKYIINHKKIEQQPIIFSNSDDNKKIFDYHQLEDLFSNEKYKTTIETYKNYKNIVMTFYKNNIYTEKHRWTALKFIPYFVDFCTYVSVKECKVCTEYFYRVYKNINLKLVKTPCYVLICPNCINTYIGERIDYYQSIGKPPSFLCKCRSDKCNQKIFEINGNKLYIINKFYKYINRSNILKLKEIQREIRFILEIDNEDELKYMKREDAEKLLEKLIKESNDNDDDDDDDDDDNDDDDDDNDDLPVGNKLLFRENINICSNQKCNSIIYRYSGCAAVICSNCGTKMCIKCGYFDINTERCRCVNDAITDIYFERRQYINVSQDSKMSEL